MPAPERAVQSAPQPLEETAVADPLTQALFNRLSIMNLPAMFKADIVSDLIQRLGSHNDATVTEALAGEADFAYLSRAEESALARDIQTGRQAAEYLSKRIDPGYYYEKLWHKQIAKGIGARNRLVLGHVLMVWTPAQQCANRSGFSRDELIAEGVLALYKAADRYNGKGQFSTYAWPTIYSSLSTAMRERLSMIAIPEGQQQRIWKEDNEQNAIEEKSWAERSRLFQRKKRGRKAKKVSQRESIPASPSKPAKQKRRLSDSHERMYMARAATQIDSFEGLQRKGNALVRPEDVLETKVGIPEQDGDAAILASLVGDLLAVLNPEQARIVLLRQRGNEGDLLKWQQVSKRLGMPMHRAQEIYAIAMKKLREKATEQKLRDFLE